jgi:hypothetical protein
MENGKRKTGNRGQKAESRRQIAKAESYRRNNDRFELGEFNVQVRQKVCACAHPR